MAQGKFEEAITAYDLAIKYQPDYSDAYYNKGDTLEKLGRHQKAKECFKKAEYLGKK